MLQVKVPIIFFGTQGFSARRDGRYSSSSLFIRLFSFCMIQTNRTSGEDSDEDLDSLSKHIKEKRPQLTRLLEQSESVGAELWETGVLKDGFDFGAFNVRA
jgi:hypothetical protein